MNHYLIVCRSVTYAQRMMRTLQRAALACHIMRIPQGLVPSGCGYAVRIPGRGSQPGSAGYWANQYAPCGAVS